MRKPEVPEEMLEIYSRCPVTRHAWVMSQAAGQTERQALLHVIQRLHENSVAVSKAFEEYVWKERRLLFKEAMMTTGKVKSKAADDDSDSHLPYLEPHWYDDGIDSSGHLFRLDVRLGEDDFQVQILVPISNWAEYSVSPHAIPSYCSGSEILIELDNREKGNPDNRIRYACTGFKCDTTYAQFLLRQHTLRVVVDLHTWFRIALNAPNQADMLGTVDQIHARRQAVKEQT